MRADGPTLTHDGPRPAPLRSLSSCARCAAGPDDGTDAVRYRGALPQPHEAVTPGRAATVSRYERHRHNLGPRGRTTRCPAPWRPRPPAFWRGSAAWYPSSDGNQASFGLASRIASGDEGPARCGRRESGSPRGSVPAQVIAQRGDGWRPSGTRRSVRPGHGGQRASHQESRAAPPRGRCHARWPPWPGLLFGIGRAQRPLFSFPELEQRGRNAILRSADEVRAEEALPSDAEATDDND